ncbi:MAG: glycerophosphodiester phosphodiesterase family protein [Bacilli bacterium]|nr:hypothetical protein [Bacilli bacterium]
MNTIKIKKGRVKMIAHRGLSGLERENTLAAFIAGGNRSFYGMECDIHKTKDGEFVVIHDYDTKRVAGVEKAVQESTLEELRKVHIYDLVDGIPKSHLIIPTLEEYLNISIKYDKVCVIEFKGTFEKDDLNRVLGIVEEKKYLHKCIFISFAIENLLYLRSVNKKVKLQFLTSKYDSEVLKTLIDNKLDIDINYNTLTKEIADELKNNKIKINVWTVDNPAVAEKLISFGVDFITTNILE